MEPSPEAPDDDEAAPGLGAALWAPVTIACLGVATIILLSLWVAGWRVEQALVVQVEPTWVAGEPLALRVLHVDGERSPIVGSRVRAELLSEGPPAPLLDAVDAIESGAAQGRFTVPALSPGWADLRVTLSADGLDPLTEVVPIEIVDERPPRAGDLTISTSTLNWGDNTEPQPESLRIVVRPDRRLLAGFDNTLMVRVTDPGGAPLPARIEVALLGGEFMGARGSTSQPPILIEATCDGLGLASLRGPMTSDVLELEVRVVDPSLVLEGEARVLGRRRFRMVSFAGAVRLESDDLSLESGNIVALRTRSLRKSRPIYVDVHGADGAWIDTLEPIIGPQPPREWSSAGQPPGLLQFEAYHYTNDPGESAELLRAQVVEGAPDGQAALEPLLERYRELLTLPRVERSFNRDDERAYLAFLERTELTADEVQAARRWLLGTLPVQVYGPPLAASTLVRAHEAMAALKTRWYDGLRIALLGGGGLFLLLLTVMVLRRLGDTVEATARALAGVDTPAALAAEIRRARRTALLRVGVVVLTMGAGIVLAEVVLDRLIWRI